MTNIIQEKFKDLHGYQIGDQGTIIGPRKKLKTTASADGYFRFFMAGRGTVLAHRIVGEAWVNGFDPKITINHKNFNKLDNRAENLEWISQSENAKHWNYSARANYLKPPGCYKKGSKHHSAKKIIVNGVEFGSIIECANELGIQMKTISKRLKNKNFINYNYIGVKNV